jgi:peptidoglycan/xylan/chitin deacetylase (PgdA/CDA1 family)
MPEPADTLALLTFDAEEFDIPGEFGQVIPEAEQMDVAARGHEAVLTLLARLEIRATFFTTARFALARPDLIRRTAAAGHEIASHGFNHTGFQESDLERSRATLEQISGAPARGFRMPRMGKVAPERLLAAGYRYNSSENPTWIPGRYNLFRAPRTARLEGELLCIPASVTPRIRFPLFWISFKTFPLIVARAAASRCLGTDGYLSLYFHPWEYTDLSSYRLPRYTRSPAGPRLLAKLESFLTWLKARARFVTFAEFDAVMRPRLSRPRSEPAAEHAHAR